MTFEKPNGASSASQGTLRRAESQMSNYSTDSKNWFVSTLRRTFANRKNKAAEQ